MKTFPRSRMAALAVVAVAGTFASAAFAGPKCTDEPRDKWIKEEQMVKKLAELGFTDDVKKLHVSKGNCWEIYGHNKEGRKIEVYFHPITGAIAEQNVK